ncbi:MAG: TrkA family potassium uptake protein [Bacteroidetes bacterium]|nr:MAG: TrkA family potassium uptake protein [Bacteroidota bacterium]
MKYIIIGLGSFGSELARTLTGMGHEVVGVDRHMSKVEKLKDELTHTICLDATDQEAVDMIPHRDCDIVIVAIGEDEGASILATALMKQVGVKRLLSRAISPLHQSVLEAMGITEILHPEREAAERLSRRLHLKGVIDAFQLDANYQILEVEVPAYLVGQTVAESRLRSRYELNVVTVIKADTRQTRWARPQVLGVVKPDTVFGDQDRVVVFGHTRDLERWLKEAADS